MLCLINVILVMKSWKLFIDIIQRYIISLGATRDCPRASWVNLKDMVKIDQYDYPPRHNTANHEPCAWFWGCTCTCTVRPWCIDSKTSEYGGLYFEQPSDKWNNLERIAYGGWGNQLSVKGRPTVLHISCMGSMSAEGGKRNVANMAGRINVDISECSP